MLWHFATCCWVVAVICGSSITLLTCTLITAFTCLIIAMSTIFACSLDVYIINAGAKTYNHSQSFELFEIFPWQRNVMIKQSSNSFVQHLCTHKHNFFMSFLVLSIMWNHRCDSGTQSGLQIQNNVQTSSFLERTKINWVKRYVDYEVNWTKPMGT